MNPSLKRALPLQLAVVALSFFIGTGAGSAQVQLNLQPGVQLNWPTPNTTNTYHLQWSPASGGSWSDLVAAITGDGTTHILFDPVPSGNRLYQDLVIVPGTPPSAALPANSGFESGTGPTASNWTVDTAVGGPVYGVRTNDSPHSGSFNFQVHLASVGAGPLVQFNQAGVPVTGGATYPFSFYSKALAGSQGYNAQWRILWNTGGDTGYQTFNPGSGSYTQFNTSVTAPASATSATIFFHIAGAAVTNWFANLDFDDVVLGSGSSNSGTPAVTNVLSVATMPLVNISWLSASNILYYAESTTNPATGPWTNNFGLFIGNGGTESFLAPMTNSAMFFHLRIPPVTVLPPTNLHQVPSGTTNAIGVAWTASISPGVTGYRVLSGDVTTTTTNSTDLGNVTSTIISGLTSGQTYFVSVIALSPNGQSDPANATITAQPDTEIGIIPLFNAFTTLQPDTTIDTPEALITYIADRGRDRHGRESTFAIYDHYLSWYWEQRTIGLQIYDKVAKGGSTVTFTYQTLCPLGAHEFRVFFLGNNTVAEYADNSVSTLLTTNYTFANYYPAPMTSNVYTKTLTANTLAGRAFQIGDRIEIEASQFLFGPIHGRDNYYGTVLLYVVGQGIIPWYSSAPFCDQNPQNDGPLISGVRTNIDSYPLPTNAWMGGKVTLPYQYSNEPSNRFKQFAGNISPTNAQPFMLGRRLHETDFGNGLHAERDGTGTETDNPIYPEQIGKLGPKFTNRSCVSCHIGNGRALPPAIGQPLIQSVIRVGSDASGTPDPVLGSVLQPQNTSGSAEDSVWISSYTIITNTYNDGTGTPYTLQQPNYTFSSYTPAFYSIRIAPQLVGMGLLEAVGETTVEALADPSDSDSDGISGRFSTVTDPETGLLRLGRFGYKASKDSVRHQIAGALNADMGVTTTVFPVLDGDTSSGPVELADGDLNNWTTYISVLGVAARRNLSDPQALQGQALFNSASCWKCHTPTLTTSPFHPMAELRNQTIHPYTDLLLHDMGPGLADNMGEGNATGSEWRTPPLWSIGLTPGVSRTGEAYLHDGRARTLDEAILWHDGEGAAAREAFRAMSASDRAALIAFLKSL